MRAEKSAKGVGKCFTFVPMSRLFAQHWKDYELIDAGNEKKLERWGDVVTIRPERNA